MIRVRNLSSKIPLTIIGLLSLCIDKNIGVWELDPPADLYTKLWIGHLK